VRNKLFRLLLIIVLIALPALNIYSEEFVGDCEKGDLIFRLLLGDEGTLMGDYFGGIGHVGIYYKYIGTGADPSDKKNHLVIEQPGSPSPFDSRVAWITTFDYFYNVVDGDGVRKSGNEKGEGDGVKILK
jgi:hypothetical protein